MPPLPTLMVAPNGARRTKADHPALPVTIPEIVATAKACFEAGADGLHAHVRDGDQRHVLDAGLYRELLSELSAQVPDLAVQITTEAVGQYSPPEQRAVVREVMPKAVSVALSEMLSDGDEPAARDFYHWAGEAGIAVQHILYAPEDVSRFFESQARSLIPVGTPQLLFVLGRYAVNQESSPADLAPYLKALKQPADWAVCAFGQGETDCLLAAHKAGGKMRIGFENSLWRADGSVAESNEQRVADLGLQLTAQHPS
ncbi:MAG: 3-keto-5-aminohexanoate cleavage protein [Pseudomonadota bacterium]